MKSHPAFASIEFNSVPVGLFAADALIWDDLASRALSYGADGGSWLDIAFPDTPMLGLWQKPGANYLCKVFKKHTGQTPAAFRAQNAGAARGGAVNELESALYI